MRTLLSAAILTAVLGLPLGAADSKDVPRLAGTKIPVEVTLADGKKVPAFLQFTSREVTLAPVVTEKVPYTATGSEKAPAFSASSAAIALNGTIAITEKDKRRTETASGSVTLTQKGKEPVTLSFATPDKDAAADKAKKK